VGKMMIDILPDYQKEFMSLYETVSKKIQS
jgi:hypothetical protein